MVSEMTKLSHLYFTNLKMMMGYLSGKLRPMERKRTTRTCELSYISHGVAVVSELDRDTTTPALGFVSIVARHFPLPQRQAISSVVNRYMPENYFFVRNNVSMTSTPPFAARLLHVALLVQPRFQHRELRRPKRRLCSAVPCDPLSSLSIGHKTARDRRRCRTSCGMHRSWTLFRKFRTSRQ